MSETPVDAPDSTDSTDADLRRTRTDLLEEVLHSARGWFDTIEAESGSVLARLSSFGRNPGEEMKIGWSELVERWNARREELETWVDEELNRAWAHIRLPSEGEVLRLFERLDALEQRIAALRGPVDGVQPQP